MLLLLLSMALCLVFQFVLPFSSHLSWSQSMLLLIVPCACGVANGTKAPASMSNWLPRRPRGAARERTSLYTYPTDCPCVRMKSAKEPNTQLTNPTDNPPTIIEAARGLNIYQACSTDCPCPSRASLETSNPEQPHCVISIWTGVPP